jgi:CRP-like cAMP-binding protein
LSVKFQTNHQATAIRIHDLRIQILEVSVFDQAMKKSGHHKMMAALRRLLYAAYSN